jgi:alkylation response protein AidB-like acyl-CoA dehydrogenase
MERGTMNFDLTPDLEELRDAVGHFAARRFGDDRIARDRDELFSREHWSLCGDLGIQGIPFPTEYGGGGRDALSAVVAMEALAHHGGDNGLAFALGAQMWSVQMPLLRFGSEAQRLAYLPRLCAGEWVGAHGMTEPDSGSDSFALRTTAREHDGGYVLDGTKTFVSNAPAAELFLVFATVDPSRGPLGITAFLVERGDPGVSVGRPIPKMGLRTAPMADVVLEDCRLPANRMLGRPGRAAEIFADSMAWERAGILAGSLGSMARHLDRATRYARERRQFGRPIGTNQAVSHTLADMATRLDAGRLLLYRAVWTLQNGRAADRESAMAKVFISEAAVQSAIDAIQIHGGYGYTIEYEVERELRDAVGGTLYSGTSEIQRNLIARSLGL